MNLAHIKEMIKPILEDSNVSLYSLRVKKENNMDILEVIVDGNHLEVGLLGTINQKIHHVIEDILPDEYYLEVSSPGLERDLRTLDEVVAHVGKYIYFKTNKLTHEGTLINVVENILFIKVNLKGRFKTFEIPYEDINDIRLAVKF